MQFNVDEFPDWPLAYTSLATVYEERGDRDKAIEVCRKGLELHPDNEDVKSMIERLEQ
jgi:Tfp pilus assembly protein PilF